ncbi:MAG: S53 family peptidase [Candidatus Bathyarchaeia archaeon]
MPGKRQRRIPSYIAFLLLLLLALAFFPVHVLGGQALPDSQMAAPLQTGIQTIQQTTQVCLTPSPADYATVQMRAASANGTIAGHVIPDVVTRKAVQKGRMPRDFTLHIELVFKLRNPDQFSKCLASISDPSSPDYGHFLNATTLAPYMPTPGQRVSIMSHLSRMGLEVNEGASPLVLKLSGPVKTIEKAFGVAINLYAEKANAGFYATDSDPMMPQNFASIVNGIMGLDNSTRPIPAEHPCSGPYCPQGIQVGYSLSSLLGNGYDGTGQEVAIVDVPGDANITSTLNTYSAMYGLPSTTLDIRYPDGVPLSYDSGWAVETALDVEAVHTVAPSATIVLLYDSNPMNAIDYVATHHLATIVSNSWSYACRSGRCSDTQLSSSLVSSVHNRLAVDAAQGLTMLFASSDDGAKPDGAVWGTEFPASDPNVLAVGGTNLALGGCGYFTCSGYASETGASISGGGYSGYFTAEPSWQTSTIGARPGRAVPDISMIGQSPSFWTYLTGSGWFGAYGTSLSTPLWAGFLAIVLQMKGGSPFGNIDPLLYQTASSPLYSSIFHDVTSGSNGYSAASGWDPVTGWGTPVASLLAPALAGLIVTSTTTSTSTVTSASYLMLTTTKTSTSYTSTTTSTSTVPAVTTVVLLPLVLTSIVQSIQYLTSILSTTVTSYTDTQASTSTIVVPTTIVLVPLTATSTEQSTQYLTSTATTTVTNYTDTQTVTSTIPTVTTVVLLPSTVTSTVESAQYVTSTSTTTVTDYTSTSTSTSTSVVYTTVTVSQAGADASSPLAYLGFISVLAIMASEGVAAGRSWRIPRSSSGEHHQGYLSDKRTSRASHASVSRCVTPRSEEHTVP